MAKIPHGFDVGAYWLNGRGGGALSTPAQLKHEIRRAYEACNVIHSGGDQDCWGAGSNEPVGFQQRIDNNVAQWITFLQQIKQVGEELEIPVGGLRGVISRDLCGLRRNLNNDFPEGKWQITRDIEPYITDLCSQISALDLEPYVAGWFFGNEVFFSDHYQTWTEADIEELADAVHDAQVAQNAFYPFYWAEFANGSAMPSRDPWVLEPVQERWNYVIPNDFKKWVDALPLDHVTPARLMLQLHFYPWGTAADAWRYRKHAARTFEPHKGAVSLELADNAPWQVWSTILDAEDPYGSSELHSYRRKFPIGSYPSSKMQFQPKFGLNVHEGSERPGHVDAHKIIRVLMNMRRQWIDVREDGRLTGFWAHAWNVPTPSLDNIWRQWTETGTTKHRYAEAIQNEFGAGAEGLPEVWIDPQTQEMITTGITEVKPVSDVEQRDFVIKYHIAPTTVLRAATDPDHVELGSTTILGKRPQMRIEIHLTDGSSWAGLVRTITEGYTYPTPSGPSIYPSTVPHGKYDADPTDDVPAMHGTAAYWDGLWDYGTEDGKNAPGGDDPPVPYRADLILDGQTVSSKAFTKLS